MASRLLELDDIAARNAAELRRLSGDISERDATIKAFEAEQVDISGLRSDRDSLAARLEDVDQRVEDIEAQSREKVNELSEKLSAGEATRQSVERQLTEATAELSKLRLEYETLRLEHDEVNQEVARLSVIEEAHQAAQAEADVARLSEADQASTDASAPSVLPQTGKDKTVAAAPETVVEPDVTPIDPTDDISREVPVMEFPTPADKSAGGQFAWPKPGDDGNDEQVGSEGSGASVDDYPIELDRASVEAEPVETAEEDDLDEINELIAQTVSGFTDDPSTPSVLPELRQTDAAESDAAGKRMTSPNPADVPVVILCGGQGTRTREASEKLPKPLINIRSQPIL